MLIAKINKFCCCYCFTVSSLWTKASLMSQFDTNRHSTQYGGHCIHNHEMDRIPRTGFGHENKDSPRKCCSFAMFEVVNHIASFHVWKFWGRPWILLREVVSNFQESGDRSKNSIFFICSKRPFRWTVFKNNIQKFQRVFILVKITKVRNRPKRT